MAVTSLGMGRLLGSEKYAILRGRDGGGESSFVETEGRAGGTVEKWDV